MFYVFRKSAYLKRVAKRVALNNKSGDSFIKLSSTVNTCCFRGITITNGDIYSNQSCKVAVSSIACII